MKGLGLDRATIVCLAAAMACTAAASAPRPDLDRLAGVYKSRFPDELVTGESYTGEDVVEIVQLSPAKAYVRVHIDAYNGHMCDLWGVADRVGDALVYKERQPLVPGDAPCVLTLKMVDSKLVLGDAEGACKAGHCGMRGSLDGASFPLTARRPIRYLPRLLASSEYKSALAEHPETSTP